MIIFSVDLVVNVLVGSLYVMAEQVIAEKMMIQMKNVREINSVQLRHSLVSLVMVRKIYVFLDRHVAMVWKIVHSETTKTVVQLSDIKVLLMLIAKTFCQIFYSNVKTWNT